MSHDKPKDTLEFESIEEARACAERYKKIIWCEVKEQAGIIQAEPEGRIILWPDEQRNRAKLTKAKKEYYCSVNHCYEWDAPA